MIDKYQVPRFYIWYCACWLQVRLVVLTRILFQFSFYAHHKIFVRTSEHLKLSPDPLLLNPAIYLLLINCCTKSCVCLSDRQYSNYWSTPPFYSSHNKLCYFQFIIFKTTQPTQCNMTYNSLLLSSMIAYVCFLKIPPPSVNALPTI